MKIPMVRYYLSLLPFSEETSYEKCWSEWESFSASYGVPFFPLQLLSGPKDPVGASQQRFLPGGSARRSNLSAFDIPFLTGKVRFLFRIPFIEKWRPFHKPTYIKSCHFTWRLLK